MKTNLRVSFFRILRVAVILLALYFGAVWLRGTLTTVRSEQAVINAEIVQIRTPINGELQIEGLRPGAYRHKGDPLFKVVNPRFGDRESTAQNNLLQGLVESLEGELTAARQNLEYVETTRKRARKLFDSKLIARAQWEEEEARYDLAAKVVATKEEQLARSSTRAQETERQMALQKECVVTMPFDGLIWSVAAKMGEQMEMNKPVLELVNPEQIWVDAFFSERFVSDLRPGLPATVRALDNSNAWTGRLRSIRAGVGRYAFDSSVAVPPPELAKRQIAVHVEAKWQQPYSAGEFFGVGRSVEVTFPRGPEQHDRAEHCARHERWQQHVQQRGGSIHHPELRFRPGGRPADFQEECAALAAREE
jgi:multidrug resistance efflux pump